MDKETALHFLRQHQPMPDDTTMIRNPMLIDSYSEVLHYFKEHPDLEAVPLLLNSFGDEDGFGMYVVVDEAIWPFSPEEVVPHLVKALRSEHQSVRYWCTQIAWKYPDPRLIDPLENILRNDAVDVRVFAASTLGFFPGKTVDRILLDAISNENETDVLEAITEALEARGLSGSSSN